MHISDQMAAFYLPKDKQAELAQIAKAIATPGKGILAADECSGLNYSCP